MKTTLKPNEKVILEVKAHWIVLLPIIVLDLVFLSISIFMMTEALGFGVLILGVLLVLNTYIYFYRVNNIWVVTTHRVIDEHGVFSINSKESPLDKIQNISFSKSLLGRMLNYGDVTIQTAAEMGASVHKNIEMPDVLKDTITSQRDKLNNQQRSPQSPSSVADELSKLKSLKDEGVLAESEFEDQKRKILDNS